MAVAAMKHMASNFVNLDKFEGVKFRRWQKKMHFFLSSMSVVYALTNPIHDDGGDDPIVEQVRKRAKMLNLPKNYRTPWRPNIWLRMHQVSCIINKLPPSWKYFNHTLKHKKEELTLVELGSHLCIEESFRVQDSNKPKSNNVAGPSVVNMVKHNNSFRDCKGVNVGNKANGSGTKGSVDGPSNSLKDLKFSSGKIILLFNVLHVPNKEEFGFKINIVNDNITSAFMSTFKVNDSILWHARLGHVHFKMMQDMSKDGLIPAFDMDTKKTDRGGEYMDTLYFQSVGIIHETTAAYTPQQNGISERKNKVLKEMVNSMLSYSGLSQEFWGEAMAVVRLPDPKLKTLGERGIKCIFVGYAEHSKAFSFFVIEPNKSVSINSIIELRDAIFDENRFSSVPRPSQMSLVNGTEDIGGSVVPKEVTEEVVQQPKPDLSKIKRNRTPKNFGPEFQLYLIEGTMDEDVTFWKEVINDEMDSIMGNNTWVLADLPLGCKPLGCKWIFKRKLKVDGTIKKFKARLVIQGFKQKSGIDYFDTYAPIAHISTIRLLIAMESIHNLIIYQMDVKTTFLNGELEEEVYMNQPQGFIMPGNEKKVCKLIKSLYGLKQTPKQWHQKFDEVVLSNGYLLNQSDKCVDLTKEFLSSRFSMKDMGEADVILGIKIKHESNRIAISQSHYIKKVLKKFNYFDFTPVSTPMDTSEKMMPNNGQAVSQLEYSRVIGFLMYDMTCTRPDIASVMGKLSRYTSNPGYTDASWISNTKDNSSTSGWVFLLGGGAISWASKKQTSITGSTMKSEFVALANAGKEAEWLRNFLLEISLWFKPIAPISIRCDSAATLEKAYN
ncbi:zinc finger, CCHC-type containing protein [Tanacetum coccineum]